VAKVNIYIPDDMLEELDTLAAAAGRSRSSLVQEAMADYVVGSRSEVAREVRRQRIMAALDDMRRMAAEPDPYPDVDAVDQLRAMRAHPDRDVDLAKMQAEAVARKRAAKDQG
jgi:predicted transcriptional regulator